MTPTPDTPLDILRDLAIWSRSASFVNDPHGLAPICTRARAYLARPPTLGYRGRMPTLAEVRAHETWMYWPQDGSMAFLCRLHVVGLQIRDSSGVSIGEYEEEGPVLWRPCAVNGDAVPWPRETPPTPTAKSAWCLSIYQADHGLCPGCCCDCHTPTMRGESDAEADKGNQGKDCAHGLHGPAPVRMPVPTAGVGAPVAEPAGDGPAAGDGVSDVRGVVGMGGDLRKAEAVAPTPTRLPDAEGLRGLCEEVLRLDGEATPGPWRSMRDGNQCLGTRYMPTAKTVAASRIEELPRPWNPHAALAFGLKAEAHEVSRFKDADADFIAHARTACPTLARALLGEMDRSDGLTRERDQQRLMLDCIKENVSSERWFIETLANHARRLLNENQAANFFEIKARFSDGEEMRITAQRHHGLAPGELVRQILWGLGCALTNAIGERDALAAELDRSRQATQTAVRVGLRAERERGYINRDMEWVPDPHGPMVRGPSPDISKAERDLTAARAEVERLTRERAEAITARNCLAGELARARAAIEAAPHTPSCPAHPNRLNRGPCTCWKSRTLTPEAAPADKETT